MTPDSAEAIVRERYPDAELQHHKAGYEMGRAASIQPESRAVYPAGGLGVQPLGVGPTAQAAWGAASTKVLEMLRKPTGLRIKRGHLTDAGKIGAGVVPVEAINAALDRGEEVTGEESDGSISLLKRAGNGGYTTKPK